jgi:hypothetical protein
MKIGGIFKVWHHKGMSAYPPECFVHQICSLCPKNGNGVGDCSTLHLDGDDLFMILETGRKLDEEYVTFLAKGIRRTTFRADANAAARKVL